ncbi:MAG: RsmD family RNA methyltransferase, partial [Candidatus Omnitrophica bacterium]|nr:RsmD family RNA methyltransferase [Candidatus Omnitrophota bacterium]
AYGLESLSRGADNATFIDSSKKATDVILKNLSKLKIDPGCTNVLLGDFQDKIKRLKNKNECFDLVFLDPPYNIGLAEKILITLYNYDILMPSSYIVVEHHLHEGINIDLTSLDLVKHKQYKDICISVYRKK